MRIFKYAVIAAVLFSCDAKNQSSSGKKLPVLGNKRIENIKLEGGSTKADTVYHTIPAFRFVDQDSNWVTNETFDNKIYVSDFFFTSCPTICPTMKKQMLRVYEEFKDNAEVAILSHTIDPAYDNVEVLHDFAEKLGVESSKWHFVTGTKDSIYDIGMKGYLVTAGEDDSAPGGYIHSGAFVLIDKKGRIRGLYDGTVPAEVNELMGDIKILLEEG